jgi:hypothetical protein
LRATALGSADGPTRPCPAGERERRRRAREENVQGLGPDEQPAARQAVGETIAERTQEQRGEELERRGRPDGAGIGISAVAAGMVPAALVPLDGEHRLPRLGHIDVVLMTNPRTAERSQVQALSQTILTRTPQTTGVDGTS